MTLEPQPTPAAPPAVIPAPSSVPIPTPAVVKPNVPAPIVEPPAPAAVVVPPAPVVPDPGDLGFSEKQLAYVKGLRSEAAANRVKAKESGTQLEEVQGRLGKIEGGLKAIFGEGDPNLTPEQHVEQLKGHNESLELKYSILESAVQNGIPAEGLEYYSFLLNQKLDALEEGKELSEEDFTVIVKEAKSKIAGGGQVSTSVNTTGAPIPQGEGAGVVTVEQFVKMTFNEKSALYGKNKELYNQLIAQAKEAKILI